MLQTILKQTIYQAQTKHTAKVLRALSFCRTSAMGYHCYECNNTACQQRKYVYHSCRNRHCPQCGNIQQAQWMDDRLAELLPISYYHVVFTLPHELNSLILGNRKALFNLLFEAASATLLQFANDKKYLAAKPGILAVLHTWGQQLSFHPHLHCIVSGGGIDTNNCWKNAVRNSDGFLFPVRAMRVVYRAIFLERLKQLVLADKVQLKDPSSLQALCKFLYQKDWNVYAKAPFAGPEHVVKYLGRYTQKVAINNKRIKTIDEQNVSFTYKDYADGNKQKQLTISKHEFIRRFEQHILPARFCKIRSYGYLSNRNRVKNVALIKKAMQLPATPPKVKVPFYIRLLESYNTNIYECPICKQNTLVLNTAIVDTS
jgi:hypothetical protein